MKNKLTLGILAFAALSINSHAATSPAPLPDLMSQAQLVQWNADKAVASTQSSEQTSSLFYTGKPLVADAGGYIFKYRTYNPEMSRWTSADPSGFPDGANNQSYGHSPLNGLDSLGLTWYFTTGDTGQSASGPFSANVDITGAYSDTFAITGYDPSGHATSLTLTISASTTASGWFQSDNATTPSTTITLNINPTSGEVTMSGKTQDDATDSAITLGKAGSAYNVGIKDGTNVVQGRVAFGNDFNTSSGTVKIGFTGDGTTVGVDIPVGQVWSKNPVFSFSINKADE